MLPFSLIKFFQSPISNPHSPFSILHSPFSILLLSLPAWLPLVLDPGLVNTRAGGDSPFLLQRVHQMSVALRAGHFPVRWMPDAAFGFGYPFWNYYAPLAYYVAAGFHLAGLEFVNAIKLTQILAFLLAAAGMYALVDDIFDSRPAAVLAAAAYTYAPFHLVNVYVRGDSLGEFVAFSFYPLILLGLRRLRSEPGPGPAVFTAVAYAGLILSHNISAFIFTPFVIAYLIFLSAEGSGTYVVGSLRRRYWLWTATAIMLGLAVTAWYWAPALVEQDAVQLEGNLTGYFHYAGHFRRADSLTDPAHSLVQPSLLFDFDVDAATTPFAMGLVQAVVGMAGLLGIFAAVIRYSGPPEFAHSLFFIGTALAATFLITPWSRPLWDHTPLLPFVQFPWRWLSVQAFGLGVVIGGLVHVVEKAATVRPPMLQHAEPDTKLNDLADNMTRPSSAPKPRRPEGSQYATSNRRDIIAWGTALSLALLLIATTAPNLDVEYLPIRDTDVTRQRLMLYEMFTGNIGSTVRAEYLPAAVQPRPWTSGNLAWGAPVLPIGAQSAQLQDREPAWQRWQVTVDESRAVVFPTYWFPGWRATIDGRPTESAAQPNHGGIRIRVPAGTHQVDLLLSRTPIRRLSELVSATAVLLLLVLLLRRGLSADELLDGVAIVAVIVAISLILTGESALARPLAGPLTMDFDRMPYLHPNPDGVRFANNVRLQSYRLSTTELEAGQTLDVGMTWDEPSANTEVEVALVSPVGVLYDVPATITDTRAALEEETVLKLHVPDETQAGIYLPRLRILSGGNTLSARTLNGAEIGALYLQSIRIRPTIRCPQQVVGELADVARLGSVEVNQVSPERLEVDMAWWAQKPISANYATSVRLKDLAGEIIAQIDTQPCYGYCPTSMWQTGVLVYDHRWLDLPPGTPPRQNYRLEIVLYEAASLTPIDSVQINNIILTEFSVRRDITPQFVFPAGLAVADFAVGRESAEPGERIPVRVTWWLQKPVERDLGARLLLLDETGEQIVRAEPVPLLADQPTSHWPLGAYVAQGYRVSLPRDLLPGRYQIAIDLEEAEGRFTPGIPLRVTPSTRTFEPPILSHELYVNFGEQIRLLGYDLKQDTNALSLQVAWQALTDIDRDYKTFIHLFDPATEQIIAQRDAEPRSGDRPTSTWVAGEVVTDGFHFVTRDLPRGIYRLAIGLYDATTGERLPAVAPHGSRSPGDRVILEEIVNLPVEPQ